MMRPGKNFQVTASYEDEDIVEHIYEIEGNISPYYPATMYRSNGDPGDPEEGGEVEITKVMYKGTDIADKMESITITTYDKKTYNLYEYLYDAVCSTDSIYENDEPDYYFDEE